MKKTHLSLTILSSAMMLVSCGQREPEQAETPTAPLLPVEKVQTSPPPKRVATQHFKPAGQESPIGTEIESEPGGVAAEMPDGKKVFFHRKLTHSGFFDESVKTLTVVKADGSKTTVDFGHGHSGYNVVELRCSPNFSRVWVVDVGALHMHNGAAIDLKEGTLYPEKWGEWPVNWALPDKGKLIIRKSF